MTLGALGEWIIRERLNGIELMPALAASVFICRHQIPPPTHC